MYALECESVCTRAKHTKTEGSPFCAGIKTLEPRAAKGPVKKISLGKRKDKQ